MSEGKISVYSVPDLKNTTDDALPNYLNSKSLGFKQDHFYTDVRLAIGYIAVTISAVLFYADWKLGWEVSKPYTLPAVSIYFLLNSAFTYWIWMVERGAIFVGEKQGNKIILSSSSSKHDPTYNLTIRSGKCNTPISGYKELKVSAPFSRWFTSDGQFTAKPFQQWLASNVLEIGKADPANVVEEIGRGSEAQPTGSAKSQNVHIGDIQSVLSHLQGQSSGTSATGGKARKR